MIRLVVVASAAIGLILFVAFVLSRLLHSRRRGISIRMQIFVALALIVGTFAFGLGLMVIDRIQARASRVATEAAAGEAQLAARFITREMSHHRLTLEQVASDLEAEANRDAGLVGHSSLELRDASGTLLSPHTAALDSDDQKLVSIDAPIIVAGRQVGSVRVFKETLELRSLLADFAPTVLVISLVLGAAAALAAAWIGREIASPIEELTAYSERVSGGVSAAAPHIPPLGREVSRLAHSIDLMRRQLQGRPFVETFAADLSHELKNPVAAIRASAETLHDGALDEPAQARHFVRRIREASERIERLLSELLSLAHIEASGVDELEKVEFKDIVEEAIATTSSPERIKFVAADEASVRGNHNWLLRAVCNLLDNALTHCEGGQDVSVLLRLHNSNISLSVTNAGEVAPHMRQNLFRRFFTTRRGAGGSGLGLAIVRAVAEAHGGQVELIAAGPPRVEFCISLPAVT